MEVAPTLEASSIKAVIKSASFNSNDANRDGHVKGTDFFDVEQFPELTFAVTGIEGAGETYKVSGDLTIKGNTRPVVLDTEFYGVNIRDEEKSAQAFERNFSIPYPSFQDKDGGILLSMTQYVPPSAVPTTLVLDREGRVAARILGLADKGTLKALISDAMAA